MTLVLEAGVREVGVDSDELEHRTERVRTLAAEIVLRYHQDPVAVVFVNPGSIPKSPSGKIRRPALEHALLARNLEIRMRRDFGPRSAGE